jgi:DNA-binding CsgD family transcriptional regulator
VNLAPRERQMVELLAKGHSPREIAKLCETNHKNVHSTLGKARRRTNSVTYRELVIKFNNTKELK